MKRSMSAVYGAAAEEDEICGFTLNQPFMRVSRAFCVTGLLLLEARLNEGKCNGPG